MISETSFVKFRLFWLNFVDNFGNSEDFLGVGNFWKRTVVRENSLFSCPDIQGVNKCISAQLSLATFFYWRPRKIEKWQKRNFLPQKCSKIENFLKSTIFQATDLHDSSK